MTFLEKLGKSNEKMTRSMIDFTISNLCPEDLGYEDVEYHVVDGRMPCAVAVITKKK